MMSLLDIHAREILVAFVLAFALSLSVSGQDCNPDEIISLPGVYKGPGKGSVRDISNEDLVRQKAVTQQFMNMVVNNYQPRGMNIGYGPAHYPPLPYWPNGVNVGNRYQTTFFLMYFYCNHLNKIEQIAETHSTIEFRVNQWDYPSSFFVKKSVDEEDPEANVFGTIRHKPVWNENGYWTMTDTVYTVRDVTHFHHLITKNRELPFVFMSRKEFLEKLRKYYQEQIEVTVNNWKNPSPEEEEYARERIEGDRSYYGRSIQNIDDFLNNSPDEVLNEPAKITGGGPPSEFESFAEGRYSYWVIKPSQKYYSQDKPASTPHFIDVLFKIYEPEVACLNAKNDILKIIDFTALQEIVDNGGVTVTPETSSAKPATDTLSYVYDLDSNRYNVMKIGEHYWMKENLRTTQYNDTTHIPTGPQVDWPKIKHGAYAIYDNNPLNARKYGFLYNGYAVATGKLCPQGWHVATDKEWKELEKFYGLPEGELDRTGERGDIADKLKVRDGWIASAFSGTNSSGFSILPAGARLENGEFSTLNQYGNFWTSTVYDDRYGLLYLWNHHVHYNTNAVGRIYTVARNGYSCRCVKDIPEPEKE